MEELLTAVTTSRSTLNENSEVKQVKGASRVSGPSPESPQDVLRILREGPDFDELRAVLSYLQDASLEDFDIRVPSALASQIIQVLVNHTIPDFWIQSREDKSLAEVRKQLLGCIRSIPGLGAILARLKALTNAYKSKPKPGEKHISQEQIQILIDLLEDLLDGEEFVLNIWKETSSNSSTIPRRDLLWREFVLLVASSRVISAVAESEDALQQSGKKLNGSWLARGNDYAKWIGLNLARMVSEPKLNFQGWEAAARLCSKALLLGYYGEPILILFSSHTYVCRYSGGNTYCSTSNETRYFETDYEETCRVAT